MGLSISRPVATSYTCSVPSSLPFFDNETAIFVPSGDGTHQSIAVAPDGSSTFGSSNRAQMRRVRIQPHHANERLLLGWLHHGREQPVPGRIEVVVRRRGRNRSAWPALRGSSRGSAVCPARRGCAHPAPAPMHARLGRPRFQPAIGIGDGHIVVPVRDRPHLRGRRARVARGGQNGGGQEGGEGKVGDFACVIMHEAARR